VVTTRGSVRAGQVLLATNATADAAVPDLERRVLPVGSYVIATDVLDPALAASVLPTGRMVFDTRNFLAYWRLSPDGRLVFGGRRNMDPSEVADARDFLSDAMVAVHPQLAGVGVRYAWGGNVAMTFDRLPHVGQLDGVWYATGCNGSGVALNTWLGHRTALAMSGRAAVPACAELRHRPIPLRAARSTYLPWVGRYLSARDAR
jgi:glycine/D-amino acid oxidase-like deaminating enzyme